MDAASISMYFEETWATIYMTLISSAISYLIGIPLGVILVVTDKDGIAPCNPVHTALGVVINIFRSIPFLILLVMVLPLTKFLVGTTLGPKAIIPPLIIASAPYIGRMVESSLKEVSAGVIEAAKSMGASNWQIIYKVLIPEAKPSLLVGAAICITTILSYSAMAGFVGGGGLGAIALNYGYYRYKTDIMMIAVVILVVLVQIIQEFWMRVSRATDKRARN
ncbi:D-methionine transport system permease protein [Oribacterium sp. KHPX15]|uniref:methionine ABC transporter permease n=1 Tax=unclassified Oribacterium TaxID=2629782 RepID=UPI0004E24FC2|nr:MULTISPECIES: methionine ABC transporter permease [unclassified Oribacterium]SEA40312.1 D-methionine transport system permease protein [Oribacterium sp. KHPX15]